MAHPQELSALKRWLRCFRMMDQRFPAHEEAEFLQALQHHFVTPSYVGVVMIVASMGRDLFSEMQHISDPLALYQVLLMLLALSSAACIACALVLRRCTRWGRDLGLESIVVQTCVMVIVECCFGGKWYAAQFFGRDPLQVYGKKAMFTETMLAIYIICLTSIFCFTLPVRSHLAWIVPTTGIVCFCVVTFSTSSPMPIFRPQIILMIGGMAFFGIIGATRNEKKEREKWLAWRQIEKQRDLSEKQRQGFSNLLNRLCDCLLTLGPNFEIMEPSPNLTAMLLLADARKQHCFCDYLASKEDRDRFEAALGRGNSEEEPTGILPLHLKDAQSREVQVHLYYTCFHDLSGSPYYLIGIIEAGVRAERTEPRELRPQGSNIVQVPSLASEKEEFSSSAVSDCSETSWSNSGNLFPLPGQSQEVNLRFDVMRFTFDGRQSTSPVIDANLLENERLLEWVSEWRSCRDFIQDVINAALRPLKSGAGSPAREMPRKLRFHIGFNGTCMLPSDFASRSAGQSGEGASAAQFTIERIRLCKRAGSRGRTGPGARAEMSRRSARRNTLPAGQKNHGGKTLGDFTVEGTTRGGHGMVPRPNLSPRAAVFGAIDEAQCGTKESL